MKGLRATPGPAIIGPLEDLLVFDPVTPLARYRGPRSIVITAANDGPGGLHLQLPEIPTHRMATGHWVQLDDPDGVNRLLDEFLAQVDEGATGGRQVR